MPQGGGKERGKQRNGFYFGGILLIFTWILASTGCRTGPVRLLPPAEIQNLAGQASFLLNGPDGVFRFRLGFYGRLPGEARLELFDPIGRLRTVVWLGPELATLYLPSEKVYWQGESRVLTSEVFGRELKAGELLRILSGLWTQLAEEDGWVLQLDHQGNVLGGERDGLLFTLKEKFPPGLLPKTVQFSSGVYTVRMKVLRVSFNRKQEPSLFNPVLPPGVKQLGWEEMAGRWKK
ncbi:MAG: hypothetical protein HPY46_00210 [Candidatus Aminicenantes bacterium]|nr:hypothetical protein [Candidatus Aminicenantes bacterium]